MKYRITAQRYTRSWNRYKALGGIADLESDAAAWESVAGNFGDVERLTFFCLAFDQIHKEGVEGSLAELGVYQGMSAAILARYARRLSRTLYLLDTFEGFDQRDSPEQKEGVLVEFSDTSLELVRSRVGEENVRYIKGYFPATTSDLPSFERYALVHLDADLYGPIMSGLEYFYPRMSPGGFLIIHDYSSMCWPGVEKAVDQFFADKPECVLPLPDGAGSVAVRKARPKSNGATWITTRQVLDLNIDYGHASAHLAHILQDGWSEPENWGVWGVGDRHLVRFRVNSDTQTDAFLECDVHAYVPGTTRRVAVRVNGVPSGAWTFSASRDRAWRVVRLGRGSGPHDVELCPSRVGSPKDNAQSRDARELGVALHGLRLTQRPR